MRFLFRFQTLLNWKQSLEELSRLTLARLSLQRERQEEELRTLLAQRAEADRFLRRSMEKGVPGWECQIYKDYAEEGYQNRVRMEARRREIEQRMEEERNRLVQRMQERKIFEKLKERRYRDLVREMERKGQKELDDLAVRERGQRPDPFRSAPE
ncbi:MAG: flagellar export protein FliJ [Desulfobacterota bacterium]|nr:flagellar export protein FliJ [Thermodesulfobacteriota bacterium]